MEKNEYGYKKLIVWQKSDELAYRIFLSTKNFPREEIYVLTAQLKRAALSVPTNITEGYSRQNAKELRQFVNIALGSLAETKYLLDFSLRLKYISTLIHYDLSELASEAGKLLWKFYKSI